LFPLVVVACAAMGLAIGSFLNVVIYRVPIEKSVVSPPSACPNCDTPVAPRDNIPVLSWLILRGRCRGCGAPISVRYPVIEGLTGLLFGLVGARFGASWSLPAELAFTAALVALAAVDLEHYLLPKKILYPASAIVLVALLLAAGVRSQWGRFGVASACAAASFAVFFAINFVRPAWMGFGDVRLSALIGLALGWLGAWTVVVGFMAANLVGAGLGLALMATGKASRRTALPYGVFLAVGSIFAVLAGSQVVHWYSGHLVR
jgi:leader peptidase (prepilin peptidase)/N-methyltransferase